MGGATTLEKAAERYSANLVVRMPSILQIVGELNGR